MEDIDTDDEVMTEAIEPKTSSLSAFEKLIDEQLKMSTEEEEESSSTTTDLSSNMSLDSTSVISPSPSPSPSPPLIDTEENTAPLKERLLDKSWSVRKEAYLEVQSALKKGSLESLGIEIGVKFLKSLIKERHPTAMGDALGIILSWLETNDEAKR